MGRKKFLNLQKQNKTIEYDYIDEEGCCWDSPESWFWSGILGGFDAEETEEEVIANF